jgi:hypothetical protein
MALELRMFAYLIVIWKLLLPMDTLYFSLFSQEKSGNPE